MSFVVGVDSVKSCQNIIHSGEGEKPSPVGKTCRTCILSDDGTTCGEVASTPLAKPAAAETDVLVLCDGEFAPRGLNNDKTMDWS